ncbi:MAG: ornithine carbamoyltransferase [candidate division Zixibacteria bacterium SM23_81]|nr:MAG: ornithine carbamoyltransferase [candidate division Zixibacteria bacterium SM23_81]
MKKDLLAITDFGAEEIGHLLHSALEMKDKTKSGKVHIPLAGKTLAMIFQKPSNRTRVSFQVGMYQLGGQTVYLSPEDIQLGQRESVADVARVMARYVDGIMARLFGHELVVELAQYASVPVINGLTDLLHPCQVLGDLLTILEWRGNLDGTKVAYVGDGNNVANSWLNAASRIPLDLRIATPPRYQPDEQILEKARSAGISSVLLTNDPQEAVHQAEVIYTDVWTSMGQEADAEKRAHYFTGYQVNEALLAHASDQVKVMHCLPAHRGQEITDQVMDGPHSVIFDQAENRMHIQKAVLVKLMA